MSVVKAHLRRLGIWFFLWVELWKYIQQNSLLPQGHCPCLNTFSYLLPKWDQKIKTCWQNQTYVKKIIVILQVCSYGFSQSWKSLEKHCSLFSKIIYSDLLENKTSELN